MLQNLQYLCRCLMRKRASEPLAETDIVLRVPFSVYSSLCDIRLQIIPNFNILLTVHNSLLCIYFNSLHVSSTLCSSSGETNCINTNSGICHSVSVTVWCAGRQFTSDLHTTRSPIHSDRYQRLY
jgi:hypothetical protein